MNSTRIITAFVGACTIGAGAALACPSCGGGQIPDPPEPEPMEKPCITDLDHDGHTGLSDLTQVLAAWGTCDGINLSPSANESREFVERPGPCFEDMNYDGFVGLADVTRMLEAWGNCVRIAPENAEDATPEDDKGDEAFEGTLRLPKEDLGKRSAADGTPILE